jgi:hypothetical protein
MIRPGQLFLVILGLGFFSTAYADSVALTPDSPALQREEQTILNQARQEALPNPFPPSTPLPEKLRAHYLAAYNQILQGDEAAHRHDLSDAYLGYLAALARFKIIEIMDPTWESELIQDRRKFVQEKINQAHFANPPTQNPHD